MSDMIEKLARIIDPDAWHETLPTDGCGVYWIGRRNKAKATARAVLEALREPTPEMEAAGWDACEDHFVLDRVTGDGLRKNFTAMIDSLLTEKRS